MKKDDIFIISCFSYDSYDYQIMKSPEELAPKEFKKLLHKVQEGEWKKLKKRLKEEKELWINGNDLLSVMIMKLEEMDWKIIEYKEFSFREEDYSEESEERKKHKKMKWEEYEERNESDEE